MDIVKNIFNSKRLTISTINHKLEELAGSEVNTR